LRCGSTHSVNARHETRAGLPVPVEAGATDRQKDTLARLGKIDRDKLEAAELTKSEASAWIAALLERSVERYGDVR
jgi:hypothetical protein